MRRIETERVSYGAVKVREGFSGIKRKGIASLGFKLYQESVCEISNLVTPSKSMIHYALLRRFPPVFLELILKLLMRGGTQTGFGRAWPEVLRSRLLSPRCRLLSYPYRHTFLQAVRPTLQPYHQYMECMVVATRHRSIASMRYIKATDTQHYCKPRASSRCCNIPIPYPEGL
jgi:hypothetical protein